MAGSIRFSRWAYNTAASFSGLQPTLILDESRPAGDRAAGLADRVARLRPIEVLKGPLSLRRPLASRPIRPGAVSIDSVATEGLR
jgi:hypothetical protein